MIKINNKAVSEVLGSVMLIAITVSAFSIVYLNFLSDEGPSEKTFVTIVGKIENGYPIFEHQKGEGIRIDSKVTIIPRGDRKEKDVRTVGELLDPSTSNGNNFWDIGERLVYPKIRDAWNVEAIIVDSKSNSVVFWGTLQEGYIEPAFGMGGWWHFDEPFWSGTSNDVEDKSGNMNYGIARNGANTINDVVSSSAIRSGMFNVNGYDQCVEVPNHCSLDITDQLTLEAWIKPFTDSTDDTNFVLDQFGYTPHIINVSGNCNLFAVVSEDPHNQGNLHTINLTHHRKLSENSIVDVEYDFGNGNPNQEDIRPVISHVSDNVYIVAYNSKTESNNLSLHLKTFNISSDGHIDYTGNMIFDDYESNIGEPNRPSMVKVAEFENYSIFAITYSITVDFEFPSGGIIKTVNISHDGKIKYTGSMEFIDNIQGFEPTVIHVSDDIFAVAYRNSFNQGVIKTFIILSDGSIEYTGRELLFDNINCFEPSFIHVSGDIFAIAYRGSNDNGFLKTFKISSDGIITSTGNNIIFESLDCFNPSLIHHSKNYYIIAYSTGNPPTGRYSSIEIKNNGSIDLLSNNILVLPSQDAQICKNPIAIKISEQTFSIVFDSLPGGNGHPGYLKPIKMEYPSDLYSRGICKLGSYGMYAKENEVFANINTVTLNSSIIADTWNYVVLTYDRTQMKLYVNGILEASTPLTEKIESTDSNLIIGELLYGLIDEVAINDRVLSNQDVYNRFLELGPIIISNVTTTKVTKDSATITWETNVLSDSIVRYGSNVPTMTIVSDSSWLTSHTILLSGLPSNTKIYYEIESTSQDGYKIIDNNGGRYYTFTTGNIEPNVPRLPNPSDGKTQIKTTIILNWIGGDEDDDDVAYDVYLGTTNPPLTRVSTNRSEEFYEPDFNLNQDTTYYWQIIAWDNHGASTVGPIWSFTTKNLDHYFIR